MPLTLLLNWRIWAIVVLVGTIALTGIAGYRKGEQTVQARFDAYKTEQIQQALKQQQEAQAREQAMAQANQQLGDNLANQTSKTNSAISNLAALRLRQHSTGSSPVSQNPSSSSSTPSTPEDGVLAECRDRRDQLAAEAQQLSDQVSGLQQYIQGVLNGEAHP